jgi:D-alanyl-D-alanine carboxypeptidase
VQRVEEELNRIVEAGLPGAFVYVEDRDGSSRFSTAGWADASSHRRMTPEHHYRVGSTTKTFTAVVALQLVGEGRLRLEDTMRDRLPDLAIANADRLTVEHLLRMRSGLFDFEDDPSLLGDLDAHLRPHSLEEVVQLGIQGPPVFDPGDRYSYCNTNFCVLEVIIQRVTGRTLGEELQDRIIGPLGLGGTSYPAEHDLTMPEPYIRGYERTAEGWRECSQEFFGRGDGALVSTAADVARFLRALLVEGRLLPEDQLKQMMWVLPDDPPAEKSYGLGLIADHLECGAVWGHSGGGFGYRHLPFLRLETGRLAVFMVNGSYGFRVPSAAEPPADMPPDFSPAVRASVYC